MAKINLDGLKFPVQRCTSAEYNNCTKMTDVLYLITDENDDNVTAYLNGKGIANGCRGTVNYINNKYPDARGSVNLLPDDFDMYDKSTVDDKIERMLGTKYLDAPVYAPIVSITRTTLPYTIPTPENFNDNFRNNSRTAITSNEYIITSSTDYLNYSIKTRTPRSDDPTDSVIRDTGCSFKAENNNAGYRLLFAFNDYCYFSGPGNPYANSIVPKKMYRMYIGIDESKDHDMTEYGEFPSSWYAVTFIKIGLYVYGFGGCSFNGGTIWDSIWKYDFTSNVWSVLPAKLPVPVYAMSYVVHTQSLAYLSMGTTSHTLDETRTATYFCRFDTMNDILTVLPNRSNKALDGTIIATKIISIAGDRNAAICIPVLNRDSLFKWGELGSEFYVEGSSELYKFNTGLEIPIGSAPGSWLDCKLEPCLFPYSLNSYNGKYFKCRGTIYSITLEYSTIGIFGIGERVYLRGAATASDPVFDVAGNKTINSNMIIPANTEIRIDKDQTRLKLLTDIQDEGSWINRSSYTIQGTTIKATLFEGEVGNPLDSDVTNYIDLSESYTSYNKLLIYYYAITDTSSKYYQCAEIDVRLLLDAISAENAIQIPITIVIGDEHYKTSIDVSNHDSKSLAVIQNKTYIYRVVGIKCEDFT